MMIHLTRGFSLSYKHERLVIWEAGENPARPRHCKRGESSEVATGIIWEGCSNSLMRESGDRPTAYN
jgi:hypothetical protein